MFNSIFWFFLGNVIASALLGGKFVSKKDPVFRNFGIGLLFDTLAFAFWTVGYVVPSMFLICITLGAIALLIALVFFFYTSLRNYSASIRIFGAIIGILAAIGIFVIGHASSNLAYISPEGLLFFNLEPMVQMLYIFALAFTMLPVIDLIASKFSSPYSALVRYGFIAQFFGGVMLITSKDVQSLYITGWVMGLVYLVLWVTLVFSKKAWIQSR